MTSSRRRVLVALGLVAVVAIAGCGLWYARRMGYSISFRPPLNVKRVLSGVDLNRNGTDDSLDLTAGARWQVQLQPDYKDAYYEGGYPPDGEGVCTDVIWRAFRDAGYDWKAAVDGNIAESTLSYPRVLDAKPDPNIDFRRVPNLYVYLKRTATSLTTSAREWDSENLAEWQPGDIVIFGSNYNHIGMVSDRRQRNGVPLVIHHAWGHPVEDNILGYAGDKITGHFRVDLSKLPK